MTTSIAGSNHEEPTTRRHRSATRTREVQRPQAEHRERVGGEHDERLLRHREDRRNRVDGEDDVGRRDDHEHRQQRRCDSPAAVADDESVAVVVGGHRDPPAQQPQRRVVLGLDLATFVAGELPRGVEQQRAERVGRQVKRVQERRAEHDEDEPQRERHGDAPRQHPGLHADRHREVAEDHREDEDVVERERALEQVAREVLTARLTALPSPEQCAERERDPKPHDRPRDRLAHRRGVVAGEREQVDRQHRDDDHGKDGPRRHRNVEIQHGERQRPSPWVVRSGRRFGPPPCGR
jgi:hypothetical protein